MEYIDVCDENGKLLGITKTKKEVHDQGLWHKSVNVWIINSKGEVLIQKRSPTMDNEPNKWDISSAGHVSAGEDCVTSAQREVEEELGLKLTKEDFQQIGEVKQMTSREGYINNEINPIYIVKMDVDLSEIKKQKEEVSEVKFISREELQRLIEEKEPTFVQHPAEYKLLFGFLEKNCK